MIQCQFPMMRTKTYMAKREEVARTWHPMDAQGQVLGRLASKIAVILRGKHKPIYTPHVDCGDGVVVVNAEKIQVSGGKLKAKLYQRYSGYPSGLKFESLERLLARRPTEVLRRAVIGMLPKNPLGRRQARRLRIYAGARHPHAAQLNVKASSP